MVDCFPDEDNCLTSLLADYQAAGGICRDSWLDFEYPGLYPVSDQYCGIVEITHEVWTGFCSWRTRQLLSDRENCAKPLNSEKAGIYETVRFLIRSMCSRPTFENFGSTGRITPLDAQRDIPLENTKHRYPWICSLRSVREQPYHICGVTLLSRPPGPTVLVTSAHCVYICKSEEGRLVPNCCCPNVGPGLCTETEDCGTNPQTVVMTGAEAEVICGEWDTATDTEEDYNVILPIEKITVHPNFNISRGELNSQFVTDDIATIHVSDENFEQQSQTHNIYPACLPTQPLPDTDAVIHAIHSGWSKAPPLEYVTNIAPGHLKHYGDFFKQWHYSMNITNCEDPKTYYRTGAEVKYQTNSYYPPGTVCAVERAAEFCPTSGESGSPLMVRDDQGRLVAEGINSFIKVLKNLYFSFLHI